VGNRFEAEAGSEAHRRKYSMSAEFSQWGIAVVVVSDDHGGQLMGRGGAGRRCRAHRRRDRAAPWPEMSSDLRWTAAQGRGCSVKLCVTRG
jgi:hypothetical protein